MSEEKKEAPAASPKKILEELDKSAAAPAETALAPLISDAMRRLDDLLARFRVSP